MEKKKNVLNNSNWLTHKGFRKKAKIFQKNSYKIKLKFKNIRKRKSKIIKKRPSRLLIFTRLNSLYKSPDYSSYNAANMLYFNLRAEFVNNLLKIKSLLMSMKKKNSKNKYIFRNGIFHKSQSSVIANSSLSRYLSIFLKKCKLIPFFKELISGKPKITSISKFYSFVINKRPFFDYLKNNIKLFLKVDPLFVKYISFFKNTFSNSYSSNNLKQLKHYFMKKYTSTYKIKSRKKKSRFFFNSSNRLTSNSNQLNVQKKLISKKRNILKIFNKLFKKIKRKALIKKKFFYRYRKFVLKKILNNKSFYVLKKFRILNKKYEKKFTKRMWVKNKFVNILSSLLNIKIINFENAVGLSRLLNSCRFLVLQEDNLINKFLVFFNSNKKGGNLTFKNDEYFFNDLNIIFYDIVSKMHLLDKNKIKINWIILNKIFLDFFNILRKNISNKSEKTIDFNKNLRMLFLVFFFNALSFIFGIFLRNTSLVSSPVHFYDRFNLLKNYKFNSFFEHFSNTWNFFFKNFPFYLIIVNKKISNKSKMLIPTSNSSVFSLNKTILKFYDYGKLIFNKIKEDVVQKKNEMVNTFVENFIKNKYKNFFFLIIKATKNNIFFTFLNRKGRLVKKGSGGMLGYEGPKRTTHLAASDNIKNIVSNIIVKYKIRKKYKYKHKFTQRYSYLIRKRKVTTKSEKKRQIFLSIIKSFFFNVVAILKSTPKNMQIKAVLESLYTAGCKIIRILNYAARSHNGCRKKKVRRL